MKRIVVGLLALMLSPSLLAASDMQFLQGLGDTRYQRIESDITGRPYHIYVMMPDGYKESPEQAYPTIYLLDGGGLFPMMAAYSRYLTFAEEMPDSIIVGISYGSVTVSGGNYRSTDYTAPSTEREYWGGAGEFQQFLDRELLPMIESTYRSRPDRRIVFGQSLGGQFVLYTALTRPGLFWGHIASNPALHRNLPFFLEAKATASEADAPSRLFVGSGTNDVPMFREPAVQWIEHWNARDDHPWTLKTVDLEGHSHMSTPPASFRQGLMWLFEGE